MKPVTIRRFAAAIFSIFLVVSFSAMPADAKEKDRCEGTKKQRRQKMDLREISEEQFQLVLDAYSKETNAERSRIADTVLRRLERKYDAHKKTGEPFVYNILILSGGGAKGAFGAGSRCAT